MIPFLLLSDQGLVKTRAFKDRRYIGDPLNTVRIFNDKEVDEIVLLDIDATPNRRGPNFPLIKDLASECFMPLAYGGGITSSDIARMLFGLGIEKIVLRSAVLQDMRIVEEIAGFAGSSSVALSIDVKRSKRRDQRMIDGSGAIHKHPDWKSFLSSAINAGAGEIILNSADRDGSMAGMDLELIASAARLTTVPLVAVGGVGSLSDISEGIEAGADAIGVGSFVVFRGGRRSVLLTYPDYAELEELLGRS